MARRLNRIVATVLSAALVILSVGFDAQQAAAQTITSRAAPVAPTTVPGLGLVNSPLTSMTMPALAVSAPTLVAPSALTASPLVAAPVAAVNTLTPVSPAAAIAEKVMAAAPALKALAKPEISGSAASIAGRNLEDILTGARSARTTGELADAVVAVPSALAPALSAPSASPEGSKTTAVPAQTPAPVKSVDSASSYSFHRRVLKAVAVITGAVFTLPQAGPSLTAQIVASAAEKTLVLSDFDDTLAGYNEVLPEDKISAISKIKAAGKHFAVISDRGDIKRPNSTQLTVFESLESLPVNVRAGMYVAANSGGKVYLYDAQGVPQLVHEAAALEASKLDAVKEASDATKARLAEVGAVQHVGDGKNPAESYNTYGYAMMLKPGSSEDAVRGAAAILSEELASRGLEVEVNPRFAKDPANPPYVTFSIITKADAASYIAKALNVSASDALVIGDAMFVPREAKKAGWLSRMGERLSGRAQAKTGNETDRNMAKGLPGILTLGVGTSMDPRVPNGWALAGKGAEVTQKVLEAVASKHRNLVGSAQASTRYAHRSLLSNPNESYGQAVKRAVEIAAERGVSADQVRFVEATAGMPVRDGDQWKYTFAIPGALISVDFDRFFGGTQDFRARVYTGAAPSADLQALTLSANKFASVVGLDAEGALLALRNALPGFGAGASVSLAARAAEDGNGAQMTYKFYDDHGSVGTVGANGGFVRVDAVSDKAAKSAAKAAAKAGLTHAVAPNELYALALANMTAKAAESGVSADRIRFLSAVHEARTFNGAWVGDEWRFFFGWGGEKGGIEYMVPARRTMVSETMMDAFEPELKGTIPAERLVSGVAAADFDAAVLVSPDAALSEVAGVSRVSLLGREASEGAAGLYYSLQGAGDELATVDARTGEIRKADIPAPHNTLASVAVWLLGAALVVAIYGGFYWAMSHAPAAVPQISPEGYNGPMPSLDDMFRGLGGMLGLGALAGTLKPGGKTPKLTNADIRATAAGVISYKGRPWSSTEYNSVYYPALERLKASGATKKQIALFQKLCADAPIRGGSFNPWSGD